MISIAIINLKGGVGKSVTTCNLAAELAAKSKSVLVVDLDKQGNTSKFFGVLDYDSPSVAEVMLGEDDILAAIVKGVDVWGVHLLPCDMRMLKANRTILMDNGMRQYHLRDALKCVAGDYDYCIMDCPPDLDMGSINALCAADWVIIPVDCDKWACDGMQEIVEQIEQVQAYYNPRLKIMGALMTKYRRTRYAEDIIVQLCASGISVLETVIRYTVKVSEAAHAGMPLLEYCPDCTAAVDYRELTEEVERIVSNVDTKEGYTFRSGQTAAIEMTRCGIMTKFQYKSDIFGENNHALTPTMDLVNLQNQGIAEAVKNGATFRFAAKMNNFSSDEDLKKERKRFSRENLQGEGGGILLFPNTYTDIKQLEAKPYVVAADEMERINTNVFNYFGTNEDVLQNRAYGDAWSAFYEGKIEPFSIQFSEVATKMLFTERERAGGTLLIATANRLQYMSNTEKLNVSAQMADRGIMNRDEIREIWNLPPLPDGQGQAYTIRGEYYLLGSDGSVTKKGDDLTGGKS